MDQLAEALRQRGGTGVADEEADELGSNARLCFRRILDCLVRLQLLLAATAAGGGATGTQHGSGFRAGSHARKCRHESTCGTSCSRRHPRGP